MRESLIWARYTWCLFHIICEKIKPEHVVSDIIQLQEIIYSIVSILPCPECRSHGIKYLNNEKKNKRYGNITSKEDLKIFMYNFHNVVNNKTGKKTFNIDVLNQYKSINILFVLDNWNKYFRLYNVDQYTIREESERKKKKEIILNYFKSNLKKYI